MKGLLTSWSTYSLIHCQNARWKNVVKIHWIHAQTEKAPSGLELLPAVESFISHQQKISISQLDEPAHLK